MRREIKDIWFAIAIIAVSVIYQVACAIQGLDLTDEGHLMILYRYFGEDLDLSKCASGYPLTCYLGWVLHSLVPQGGILAMRLWGILIVTIIEIISYLYLRHFFESKKLLLLGLLIQTVFVAGDPKPFGYNTLSGLFAIVIVILLNEGSRNKNWLFLLLGGVVMGLSPYLRLPNVVLAALVLIPMLYCIDSIREFRIKHTAQYVIIVGVGFLAGLVVGWKCMCLIGADKLIYDFLFSVSGQLEGDSTHNLGSMLSRYTYNYFMAICYFVFFVATIGIFSITWDKNKWFTIFMWTIVVVLFHRTLYVTSPILGDHLLFVYNGISLFAAVYYIIHYKKNKSEVAISAAGISVLLPLGSDLGFITMWVGTTLSLPIGLCAMKEWVQSLNTSRYYSCSFVYQVNDEHGSRKKYMRIRTPKLHKPYQIFLFVVFLLLAETVVKIDKRAYYDIGSRFSKVEPIHSAKARGIYTHKYKADVVNSTLREMAKYVSAGDVILVYDFSPMLYYLTDTKPWAGVAWPCVYYGMPYVRKFNTALQEADSLPVVVMQHFYSSNAWTKIKSRKDKGNIYIKFKSLENKDQAIMNECVLHFLKYNNYKTVWNNGYYEILLPKNKHVINREPYREIRHQAKTNSI